MINVTKQEVRVPGNLGRGSNLEGGGKGCLPTDMVFHLIGTQRSWPTAELGENVFRRNNILEGLKREGSLMF